MNPIRLSNGRRIVLLGFVLALLGVAAAVSANLMPGADDKVKANPAPDHGGLILTPVTGEDSGCRPEQCEPPASDLPLPTGTLPDSSNSDGSCSTAAGCDKGDAKNKDGTVRCLSLDCGPDTPVNSGTIPPEARPPDRPDPGSAGVSSYDECVKAGYPIAESYPPQCFSPNGSFTGPAN